MVVGELSSFGATKSATPILETARSISIETEERFRDKGALTLDDTLNYSAGVVGDTFGFSTRGDFPRVRGFDAAEFRDGQQVLFGFYNNTRSDIYMLEQVEVLKGPASVLYGKGTPGGIVNAVSKVAGPDRQSEILIDGGTHDRRRVALDYNLPLGNDFYLRLVGLYRDSDSQIDFVHDDARIVMPSLTYDNGTTRVTALVEYADRDADTAHQFLPLEGTACVSGDVRVIPEAVCVNATGERTEDSTFLGQPGFNRYDTRSTLVSLLGSHRFSDAFSLDGVFRYKDGEADYRQAWINFTGVGNPRTDAAGIGNRTYYWSDAASEQAAFDLRARYTFSTGPLEHEVFVGASYQEVETSNALLFAASQGTLDVYDPVYGATPPQFLDPANLNDPGPTKADDLGVYVSNQVSWGDFKFNLGLRHDETETRTPSVTQKDDATSFSAGVLYTFANGLAPYASFAESFQPVIGTDGFTQQPLKPREGEQWEVGFKFQPPGTRAYFTLAYFEIEESNLPNPATLIGQPGSQQEGVGKVTGFEFEGQYALKDWYFELNFSALDTATPDKVPFPSIPEDQASAWVQYQPASGPLANFRIGTGLRYSGERESNGNGAIGPVRIVTDGEVLADLLVGYRLQDWDMSLNVRNVADEKYFGTCLARGDCFPGERRTVVLSLARRF